MNDKRDLNDILNKARRGQSIKEMFNRDPGHPQPAGAQVTVIPPGLISASPNLDTRIEKEFTCQNIDAGIKNMMADGWHILRVEPYTEQDEGGIYSKFLVIAQRIKQPQTTELQG